MKNKKAMKELAERMLEKLRLEINRAQDNAKSGVYRKGDILNMLELVICILESQNPKENNKHAE